MKKFLFLISLFMAFVTVSAQSVADSVRREVVFETTSGSFRVMLYNDTPLHRDQMLRLVAEGYYDGLLFHRVIPNFMIQAGDSASRHAQPGVLLGDSREPYAIPAEIRFPVHCHKRGALAAARESDQVNPERKSSYSQFYIVIGSVFSDPVLDKVQERIDKATGGQVKLTPEVREIYRTQGGTPHLDGQYTVYGEVVEGMEVVEQIQWAERDENNRPLQDVRILKARIVK